MSNKSERLYDAITNISDTYIEEAQDTRFSKKSSNLKSIRRFTAVAAAFAVVIFGVFAAYNSDLFDNMNDSLAEVYDSEMNDSDYAEEVVTEDSLCDDAAPGEGVPEKETNECIPYSGYVFPMTIDKKNADITVTRNISFDFIKNITIDAVVTDSYVFNNTSDADVTITVLYPFEISYGDSIDNIPTLALNGEELKAELKNNNYDQGIISESYLESKITIPAGESATISAETSKVLDTRYGVAFCYELFTNEGSIVEFTEQTATIIENGSIEIVDQNFGFDLENDVNSVILDQSVEYYYLVIN